MLIRADGCAYRWESVTFTRVNLSLVQGYSDDGVVDDDHHGLKSSPLPRLINPKGVIVHHHGLKPPTVYPINPAGVILHHDVLNPSCLQCPPYILKV